MGIERFALTTTRNMGVLGSVGLASSGEDQHRQPTEETTRRWRGGRRDESPRGAGVKLWILALLGTAGVSLFLFLAIVCKVARVAASSDVAAVVRLLACNSEHTRESVSDLQGDGRRLWVKDRGFCAIPRSPHLYT